MASAYINTYLLNLVTDISEQKQLNTVLSFRLQRGNFKFDLLQSAPLSKADTIRVCDYIDIANAADYTAAVDTFYSFYSAVYERVKQETEQQAKTAYNKYDKQRVSALKTQLSKYETAISVISKRFNITDPVPAAADSKPKFTKAIVCAIISHYGKPIVEQFSGYSFSVHGCSLKAYKNPKHNSYTVIVPGTGLAIATDIPKRNMIIDTVSAEIVSRVTETLKADLVKTTDILNRFRALCAAAGIAEIEPFTMIESKPETAAERTTERGTDPGEQDTHSKPETAAERTTERGTDPGEQDTHSKPETAAERTNKVDIVPFPRLTISVSKTRGSCRFDTS